MQIFKTIKKGEIKFYILDNNEVKFIARIFSVKYKNDEKRLKYKKDELENNYLRKIGVIK
jgi:hypothetical protein